MTRPTLRFAPSPNGKLHLGHALSALLNVEAARRLGGRFLVRIEDIDGVRSTEANIAGVLEDLDWLGVRSAEPPIRQSSRFPAYRAALDDLIARGLVYRCFATRSEIAATVAVRPGWPCDPDGAPVYPGLWRDVDDARVASALEAGLPFAWRLDMVAALERAGGAWLGWQETGAGPSAETGAVPADPARWGDVVLARKDTPTSYHLAVVVDDAEQAISHVVRGCDLFHATAVHVLLQRLLGLPQPRYHHHRLVTDTDGRKLAKSRGSASLRSLSAGGASPADALRLIGWAPERDLDGLV
jgi:glutamyl-Q tRNA(Asp) synthetase